MGSGRRCREAQEAARWPLGVRGWGLGIRENYIEKEGMHRYGRPRAFRSLRLFWLEREKNCRPAKDAGLRTEGCSSRVTSNERFGGA